MKIVFFYLKVFCVLQCLLTFSAGSTSSDSFDGDNNGIRHSTNSEHSPEPSTSTYPHSYVNSNNQASENNDLDKTNEDGNEDDDEDDR